MIEKKKLLITLAIVQTVNQQLPRALFITGVTELLALYPSFLHLMGCKHCLNDTPITVAG